MSVEVLIAFLFLAGWLAWLTCLSLGVSRVQDEVIEVVTDLAKAHEEGKQ